MAISWDSIRAVVIFLGPILIPKAISYYRSVRTTHVRHGLAIRPAPPRIRLVIFLLSLLAFLLVLYSTLPQFSPENLFLKTQSRVQIPVDVLFTRIAAMRRPQGMFTAWDHAFRAKFVNLESRLLYFQFGPQVLAECPFCSVDEPRSFFYYAIPSLLWPHIYNLIVLALATSPSLTERYGSRFRTSAVIGASILAVTDLYLVGSYKYQINARALKLTDIDFFYWNMRTYRLLALAALDASLASLIWLSSTNRAFTQLPSPAERIELLSRAFLTSRSKLNALGIIKNTITRDENLRSRDQSYWQHEVRLMGEVMEEREVIEGVNDALSNRIDIQSITKDAEQYAENVLQPLNPSME